MENNDTNLFDTKKRLMELHKKCEEYRGQLLHPCIMVEQIIEDIIALYFIDDRQKLIEFREIFLGTDKINVSHKRELLGFILKKRFSYTLEKNKEFLKKIEDIYSDRNIVAHARINESYDLIKNFDGNIITFYMYKTDKGILKERNLILSREIVDKKITEMMDVFRVLLPLAKTLRSAITQPKTNLATEM